MIDCGSSTSAAVRAPPRHNWLALGMPSLDGVATACAEAFSPLLDRCKPNRSDERVALDLCIGLCSETVPLVPLLSTPLQRVPHSCARNRGFLPFCSAAAIAAFCGKKSSRTRS